MDTKMHLRALLGLLFSLLWLAPGIAAKPSRRGAKATVSFKETNDFCETTANVKSYAGYVRLPAGSQYASYEQNIFFWFFEARSNPKSAPLTVWLQGGPGMGSTSQALGGNGPCRVLDDSATTEVNEWSWNTHSNMLYIDQPVQAGFSYDTATPGRLELLTGVLNPDDDDVTDDMIFMNGTFGSGDDTRVPPTTATAAEALWDFMQVWMVEKQFKNYRRDEISIWSQSYGGHWAPGIASHFVNKSPASGERTIGISNIGIFNGLSDFLIQGATFPEFGRENTYGVEVYTQAQADEEMDSFEAPGGCKDQAVDCQELAIQLDPGNTGTVLEVNAVCASALGKCLEIVGPLQGAGLNGFDITQDAGTQFPEPYANGFLNRESVQKKLGVDIAAGKGVNYTYTNPYITDVYAFSGDYLRKDFRLQLGELLDRGIPVTLAHGDRDFNANWFGGEALSLQIPFDDSDDFGDAGYADFMVDGDVAGKTRQAGLLSFTRVFQAGHEVPYYTPKASHALFTRAHKNKDIPTGSAPASASNPSYSTTGPSSVRDVTDSPQGNAGSMFCYIMNPPLSTGQCSNEQLAGIADGSAVVEDFIVVG